MFNEDEVPTYLQDEPEIGGALPALPEGGSGQQTEEPQKVDEFGFVTAQ